MNSRFYVIAESLIRTVRDADGYGNDDSSRKSYGYVEESDEVSDSFLRWTTASAFEYRECRDRTMLVSSTFIYESLTIEVIETTDAVFDSPSLGIAIADWV